MQIKKILRTRILSFALSLAMVFTMLPTAVFASAVVASEAVACHTAHTADCGYVEETASVPATEETPCDKACEGAHIEGCAYAVAVAEAPAVAGAVCQRTCALCVAADSSSVSNQPAQGACSCTVLCAADAMQAACLACGVADADLVSCKGTEVKNAVDSSMPEPWMGLTAPSMNILAETETIAQPTEPYFDGNDLFALGQPVLLLKDGNAVKAYWDKDSNAVVDTADSEIVQAIPTEAITWNIYGGQKDTAMTATDGSQITLLCGGVASVNAGSKVGGDAVASEPILRMVRIATDEANAVTRTGFNTTQYKVTFDPQGSSYPASSIWQTLGAPLAEPPSKDVPTKAALVFLGFYDSTKGNVQYYHRNMVASQGKFTQTKPITLYAKWSTGTGIFSGRFSHYQVFDCQRFPNPLVSGQPINVHSFKVPIYDANGAGSDMTEDDVRGKIFYFLPTGVWDHPFMLYMADDVDGTNERPISGNGKITALGKEGFLFESRGSWKGYFISLSQGFNYGGSLTYTPPNLNEISEEEANNVTGVSPNPWDPNKSYAIQFDSQGADKVATPSQISVLNSTVGATIGQLPTEPVKAGFDFGGWYTAPNGAGDAVTEATPVTENATVYAKWVASPIAAVTIKDKPKITYAYGDSFHPAGLTVLITYANGTSKTIPYASNEGQFAFTPTTAEKLLRSDNKIDITFTEGGTDYPLELAIVVSPKELTATVTSVQDKTYDGNASATGIISLTGVVNGETVTASGTLNFDSANAGENKAVAATGVTITTASSDVANYTLKETAFSTAITASIRPKNVTIQWAGIAQRTYDGSPSAVSATANGIVAGDACPVTVDNGTHTNAAEHTATARIANSNYVINGSNSATYTIAKAMLTAKFKDQTIVFGQTPDLVLEVTGFVNSETASTAAGYVAPTLAAPLPTAVSDTAYEIALAGGTATNYSFALATGALIIQKADMSTIVTASGYAGIYDAAAHGIAVTAPAGATVTYTVNNVTSNNQFTNAGRYTVAYTVTLENYATVTGSETVTINKKPLTPTLNPATVQGKTYDKTTAATIAGIPIALDGIIGNEAVTATATITFVDSNAGANKAVDVNNITLSGAGKQNYTLFATNLLNVATAAEITPLVAKLAWSPASASFVYDGTAKNVTASVTNRRAGDSCEVVVTDGSATIPGTYSAAASKLSNTNYALPATGLNHPFTIVNATITGVAATPTEKNYDGVYSDGVLVTGQLPTDDVQYSTAGENGPWSKNIPQVGVEGSSTDVWVKVERAYHDPITLTKVTAIVKAAPKVRLNKPAFDPADAKQVTVGGAVTEGANPIASQAFEIRKVDESTFTLLHAGTTSGKSTAYEQVLTNLTENTQYELRLTAKDSEGVTASTTLKFRTQAKLPTTGGITGDVAGGTGKITVTLELGNTIVASVGNLSSGESFSFRQLPDGVYNVVATDSLGKHVTMLATVKNGETTALTTMTIGLQQSAVEVKNDAPPVAADGLQELFDSNTYKSNAQATDTIANGGTVEIKLTANEAKMQAEIDAINASVGSDTVSLFIDIKVDMIITPNGLPSTVKNLTQVDGLLTVAVPLPADAIGKTSYKMYRYHNGKVEALRQIQSEADKAEGTFRIDAKYAYVYSSKFSTYAITYATSTGSGGGNSGNNGSGSSSSTAPATTYTITAAAGTGGTISTGETVQVREGDSAGFTFTPSKGYQIADVLVNGKSIGAKNAYVFTNVRSNQTILVTFKQAGHSNPQTGVACNGAVASWNANNIPSTAK